MKIKYEFATETVEIEVTDEWAAVLVDLDRQEYNNDHAETRRHCSLNALNLDDTYLPSDVNLERDFFDKADRTALHLALTKLEPRQQYLIHEVYFLNRKYVDIAREEGKDPSSIRQATERAVKRLKKYYYVLHNTK